MGIQSYVTETIEFAVTSKGPRHKLEDSKWELNPEMALCAVPAILSSQDKSEENDQHARTYGSCLWGGE